MVWQLSDIYGVEEDLEAMGDLVWSQWEYNVRPCLLEDPSPTNSELLITQNSAGQQVWIPDTDIFVRFELGGENYIFLIGAVDMFMETRPDV